MPESRYKFDEEFDISRFNTRMYDESILSNKQDERIAARREARKAKYAKNANEKIISQEEIAQAKKKKKHKINVGRASLFVAVFILAASFVAVQGLNLLKLRSQRITAEKELEALQLKVAELENELSELDSEEYIENSARSELHMIKNGEVMYIVDPGVPEEKKEDNVK